jgi:hypothetical protein
MSKNKVEIQTIRHIYLGDLLDAVPGVDSDAIWQAVIDSDISFGNNAETLINTDDLYNILDAAEVSSEDGEKIMALIPEGVLISLGS